MRLFDSFRNLLGGKPAETPPAEPSSDDQAAFDAWYYRKEAWLQEMLGAEHDRVMHAILPYAIGGGLDLYYYPNHLPGTAVATKELSEAPFAGSNNAAYDCYELVMFTRHPLDLEKATDDKHPFGRAHRNINAVLNAIARYSAEATLNPCETIEFPLEIDYLGGKCLVLDGYDQRTDPATGKTFGLLLVLEVLREEMDFARQQGGQALLDRLKAHGDYPCSDLDREPVV
ncbi:MAG: suppressor of fused domain protein [Phycisphaerae bacterium]